MICLFGNLSFYLTLFFIIIFYLGWGKKIFLKDQVLVNLIYLGGITPFIFLVIGFTVSDFSILNVIQNSYIDDPLFFKITFLSLERAYDSFMINHTSGIPSPEIFPEPNEL